MAGGGRRYQVKQLLGKGGFGSVYLAQMIGAGNFQKPVAIKVLNPEVENIDEVAARFRDEARVLGLIRHRAIVTVEGLVRLSTEGGGPERWGVIMEYVEGISLKVLRNHGPTPPCPTLEIIEEIARALHAAWNKTDEGGRPLHMIHRDIKPSNIQLTAEGEVKLLDFGIARAEFDQREAETRSMMFGSLTYMSPERVDKMTRGHGDDGPESDIYALGAVLLELLMGQSFVRLPLQRDEHQAELFARMDELWSATGGVSEALVQLVNDMLHHEARERPTARTVAQRAARIARDIGGQRLRDWAERVVPPLLEQHQLQQPNNLTSSVFIERTGTVINPPVPVLPRTSTTPPPPPPSVPAPPIRDTGDDDLPPRRSRIPLLFGGVGLTAGALALLLILPRLLAEPEPEPAPAPPPPKRSALEVRVTDPEAAPLQAAVVTLLAPGAEPAEHALTEDGLLELEFEHDADAAPLPMTLSAALDGYQEAEAQEIELLPDETGLVTFVLSPNPRRSAPKPRSAPAPEPAPEPEPAPAPPPAPEPAPEPTRILVGGEAQSVYFSGGGQRHTPGVVPAGSYQIYATFPGQEPKPAGTVRVNEGETARLNCIAALTLCKRS